MTDVVKEEGMKRRRELRLAAGEIEILEVLWHAKSATISETHESFSRKVGYTTVQTRLNRLVEKGLVKKAGSHPASYQAVIQPEDVSRDDLKNLVDRVTGGRVVPLVAHLVKDRKLSADEIRELKQLINEAEKRNRKLKSGEGKQ
jgi:predicted transcriptional regulator